MRRFGGMVSVELKGGLAVVVKPDPAVRRYVNHFATCPRADSFRKPKPPKAEPAVPAPPETLAELERMRERSKEDR